MTIILCLKRYQTKTSASRSTLTSMSNGEIQDCWSAKITARRDANQRWSFFSMWFLRVLISRSVCGNTCQWWCFFFKRFLGVLITIFLGENYCYWRCFFSMCLIRVLITRFITHKKTSSVCNFPDVAMCLPFRFPRPVLCSVAIIVCLRPLLQTAHKGPILYIFRHIKKADYKYSFPVFHFYFLIPGQSNLCVEEEGNDLVVGWKVINVSGRSSSHAMPCVITFWRFHYHYYHNLLIP